MTVLGDVDLDEDGVLHGWCWDPSRPAERLTVDILIDDEVIASPLASTLREDLKFRQFGDGRHGFTVALTRQMALVRQRRMLRARERSSGVYFWHLVFREFSLPPDYAERLQTMRDTLGRLGQEPALDDATRGDASQQMRAAFAGLGTRLRAQAGIAAPLPAPRLFTIAAPAAPALSVILDMEGDAPSAFAALRRAAPALEVAMAETILTDDGTDPRGLRLQKEAGNLGYLRAAGLSRAARRNLAAQAAQGGVLAFLQDGANWRGDVPGALAALAHGASRATEATGAIIVSAQVAARLRRIAPHCVAGLVEIAALAWPELALAAPRAMFQAVGGFDTEIEDSTGLEILDFVLRAAAQGVPVLACRPSGPSQEEAWAMPFGQREAAQRFAARWMARGFSPPAAGGTA